MVVQHEGRRFDNLGIGVLNRCGWHECRRLDVDVGHRHGEDECNSTEHDDDLVVIVNGKLQ